MDDSPHASLKQCAGECQQFFPATPEFFSRNKNRKDGLQTLCKTCISEYKKQYYQTHKDEISEKHKVYAKTHKEQVRAHKKQYAEAHKDHLRDYHKQYYEDRKEQWSEQGKQRYVTHGEQIRERVRRYQEAHKEQISERGKLHRQLHREQISERRKRLYHSDREHFLAQKKRDHAKHKEQRLEKYKVYRRSERGRLIRRALWHKREAQKKTYGGVYTAAQIQEQLKRQNYRCYYAACGFAKFQKVNGRYIYHIEHTIPLSRAEALPRNDISHIVLACSACNLSKGTKLPHEWFEGGRLL